MPFAAKTPQNEIRIHATLDDFDGDAFLKNVVVAHRQIDRAHSATPQFAFDFVGANALANQRRQLIIASHVIVKLCDRRKAGEDWFLNKAARLFVGAQKGFNVAAQFAIAVAGFSYKGRTRGRRLFQRRFQ